MSLSVTCYAQPDKDKSQRVLEAFAAGCGARMAWTTAREIEPGAAVFYGVRPPWAHLWEQAKRERRDWYFIDNAYHDVARERYFRVTKNAIQHTGMGETDGRRFAALGHHVKPVDGNGQTVIACAQSDEFMRTVAGDPEWLPREVDAQRRLGRMVLIRHKGEARPLSADLSHARLLLTWSSAAAVGAIMAAVPVKCAPQCCAYGVAMDDRERWAGVLADHQFTLREMESGLAWKGLRE